MTTQLPAGWAPSTEVLGAQWAAIDPGVQDVALQLAVAELWALSGRQYGTWSVRLAPYIAPTRAWYAQDTYLMAPYFGYSINATTGAQDMAGLGTPPRAFRLPGPVVSVEQVDLRGATLVRGVDWEYAPDGRVVYLGTELAGWPVGQNVYQAAPDWVVTYTRGTAVPVDAQVAAARYALALAHGLGAPGQDRVPGRARDITRNGTNMQLAAPEDLSNAGLTGVPLVDAWLRTVNPNRLTRPSTLWAPELSRHRILPPLAPDPQVGP